MRPETRNMQTITTFRAHWRLVRHICATIFAFDKSHRVFLSVFGRRDYPGMVALAVALQGPCSPLVLTQRKAHQAVLPASALSNSMM